MSKKLVDDFDVLLKEHGARGGFIFMITPNGNTISLSQSLSKLEVIGFGTLLVQRQIENPDAPPVPEASTGMEMVQ